MSRRVEIILERYKDDYPAAMGELNVRKNILEKRLEGCLYNKAFKLVTEELNDIKKLLSEYQKPKQGN